MKTVGSRGIHLLFTVTVIGTIASTSAALAAETTVTIDASKPGITIRPFIYGQFIEHMGRCIRGGIWAEMLHDRKFLLPPDKSSKAVGPEEAGVNVAHDTAGGYCGDHAMALWVRNSRGGSRGIRQDGLVGGRLLPISCTPAPCRSYRSN